MLQFSDAPYQFFPAKPSRMIQRLCEQANKHFFLSGPNHRIKQLEISGGENLQELLASGARVLLVANHPTHSDPQVMTEVLRRLGLRSCFMAAYDVFLRKKACAWVMQRHGAFSVDREGSDKQSMKEAIRILKEGEYAMTIFPEGNVYLNNDRVTPFMEGAAFVSMRAQKELGSDVPIYAVPISFKMTYLHDVRDAVKQQMDKVARIAGMKPDSCESILEELQEIGRALLVERMRECEHLSEDGELGGKDWSSQFEGCSEKVIGGLEEKMELAPKIDSSLTERIRRIRAAIHHIRIRDDGENKEEAEKFAHASEWADEAILAFRTLTYATPYVADHPSLDRFAETSQKMGEDYTGKSAKPLGDRAALVHVGEPLHLGEMLDQHDAKLRPAVAELTTQLETAVQSGVDLLNKGNKHPGGELF